MKKMISIAAALIVGLQLNTAQATPISVNAQSFLENGTPGSVATPSGGWMSILFSSFTLNQFNPTSTYTDTNGVAGINTGDKVVDTGNTFVSALNGTSRPQHRGGFNDTWGLDVQWTLAGFAIVAGTDFIGDFKTGEVIFSLVQYSTNRTVQALKIAVTGSALGTPGSSSVGIDLFGKVTYAIANTFFDQYGRDFATNLNKEITMNAFGNSDIKNLNNAPKLVGKNADGQDVYTRNTFLSSVDVAFDIAEPSSLAILGLSLLGFGLTARSKKRKI